MNKLMNYKHDITNSRKHEMSSGTTEREEQMQILNRWDGSVIAEGDMPLRALVLHKISSDANLRGANLSGADLSDANLCGANLRGANLCGANLRGANLCGANLRGANLCGADLRGANLCGADLRGANLRGANLRDADLSDANLDYSAWPLQCSSLKAKVCDKISAQLLFHAFAVSSVIPTTEQLEFMQRNFHRFDECGGAATVTDKKE
jgi:uncharacterized protein YjbI with pentapeptide repeats